MRLLLRREGFVEFLALALLFAVLGRLSGMYLPVFVVAVFVLMWRFGFDSGPQVNPDGSRKKSAWSVFNEGAERLPGTFGAEYADASIRSGGTMGTGKPTGVLFGRQDLRPEDEGDELHTTGDEHEQMLAQVREQAAREKMQRARRRR